MATKKISLLDRIAVAEDVEEVTLPVPEWGEDVEILFRGMSLAALYTLQSIDMAAAENGDINEVIKMLQATACDPETKLPIFVGDHGEQILRQKNYEVLLRLLNEGALVVLGADPKETVGKG